MYERNIESFVLERIKENQCGVGNSLYSVQEFLSDLSSTKLLCAKMSNITSLRLAGYGIAQKNGTKCNIMVDYLPEITEGLCG